MKRRVIALVASVGLMLGSMGFGQTPSPVAATPVAPVDIYAHFVGTWVGTNRYRKDGAERNEPVKIVITEETKKERRLRLSYSYGEPGHPGFDRDTRFVALDPEKSEMTLSDPKPTKYHTADLEAFAKTGYGNFTATGSAQDFNGRHVIYRYVFVLAPDQFGYVLYQSVDGQQFTPFSVKKLSREKAVAQIGSTN